MEESLGSGRFESGSAKLVVAFSAMKAKSPSNRKLSRSGLREKKNRTVASRGCLKAVTSRARVASYILKFLALQIYLGRTLKKPCAKEGRAIAIRVCAKNPQQSLGRRFGRVVHVVALHFDPAKDASSLGGANRLISRWSVATAVFTTLKWL